MATPAISGWPWTLQQFWGAWQYQQRKIFALNPDESLVFEQHGRSVSMIPPLLLLAAMELHDHLDPSTRQSFLSVPVWHNIVVNDPRIWNHPLHRKALKFIESSNQSVLSPPPVHAAEHVILDALADPPVGSIPKPKVKPMRKKTLKVVDSSDSDGIEIIDHATVDRKLNVGKQHKSIHWCTPSMEYTEDLSPEATGDVAKELVVGTIGIHVLDQSIDINMANLQNAAPRRLSLPPITAVSTGSPSSVGSSPAVMHLPPSHTQHMDIDVPVDTVVKDLQAMTLEVEQDSVSVLKSHEEIYNTIHDLHNQVLKLCAWNAAAAKSLEALNVHVAAQDVEMHSMKILHANVAVLQEQVCALHEESQTHDNQLHAADVKLASQGSTIAILQDVYEALWQRLIPTPSIPPHYNHTMFFHASHQHQPPYNQNLKPSMATGPLVGTISAGASLPGAMHALPGPSTVAGPSLTSGMHAPSGPSGSHVTRSSQSTGNLGESASAFRRN
ncbi:hypothetical protein EV424DRAFT_1545307 [Suillus variegatus]|nr:hypothetical protein EV424DRAFT_1545307 [Suillus variegatus]